MHLHHVVGQVDQPVVWDVRPGVETALVVPIEGEGGFGHLEYQRWTRPMRGQVVAGPARHGRNVRLWFGLLVERDRSPATDVPTRPEDMFEGLSGQHDGGRMGWTLPLLDDNLATHQLKALVWM